MKTKTILLALASAGLLAACSPPTPQETAQVVSYRDTTDLCSSYRVERIRQYYSFSAVRDELQRRGVVRAEQWPTVDAGEINVGMTWCEALASLGKNSDLVYVGEEGQFSQFSTALYHWDYPFRWAYMQRGSVTETGTSVDRYNKLLTWMMLDPDAPPPDPDE